VAAGSAIPDGVELKQIDPSVVLGQLVAFATDQPWSASAVGGQLVRPDNPFAEEGPRVVCSTTRRGTRRPASPNAGPASRSSTATPTRLRTVAEALIELAGRARAAGEPLVCHMSL
jgi:hypothetical protein